MHPGVNDPSAAPMEIDALQQHGDKKCHTCGRFGHLSKDCWLNKSKSKGKSARQPMVEKTGVFEVSYDLSPFAVGLKHPPRRGE